MTEDELNSLIAHAHRRIEQLQKQLARQLATEEQHTSDALAAQKAELEQLHKQRLQLEAEKLRGQFAIEKQNWVGHRTGFHKLIQSMGIFCEFGKLCRNL